MNEYYLSTLQAVCNLPTAPYAEQHVIAYLLQWAEVRQEHIRVARDAVGNVYLHYGSETNQSPLVIEAHMDHPGFCVERTLEDGRIEASFLGGVRPSHFSEATAALWLNDPPAVGGIRPVPARGRWLPAKVLEVEPGPPHSAAGGPPRPSYLRVILEKPEVPVPDGTLGMWHLPDAFVQDRLLCARVCDDLAGVAAQLCLLDELIAQQIDVPVIVLCTRAEEVGFAGVLAVAQNGWIPRNSRVLGLETSKASELAPQGAGAVIRVGDKIGIFSPGLTHFVAQSAAFIADDDPAFKFQRKLMDGGTCNSTAFVAFGYDASGLCLPLGNYHNQAIPGDVGYGRGATAGPGIATETIDLDDFASLVRILVRCAQRFDRYVPGFGEVRDRLANLYHAEQRARLYGTSDQRTDSYGGA